ncbi:SGNH/GDSL hydrolase family protein [Carboxylicivirga taeanensis]|uniref:SGNH/GDSL hydrolase family protein n=1 Tax=Carboxylicivirga taeanensis TaxID=1416875 RepID=UPI003F6E21C5
MTVRFLMICFGLFWGVCAQSQQKYYDAASFPLYGKVTNETGSRYERLPASLEGQVRDRLFYLGTNSAGLYLRFRSNAKTISASWELTGNVGLNHMAAVGVKGLDLYGYKNGEWRFVNSGKPTGKKTTATIIDNMKGEMCEYMLYLPLYDGLEALRIGVDSTALIEQPQLASPVSEKPVVFYGTSITQGACASRPGMAATNILSRRLNREVINLGFSGNGQLDYEIADVMAGSEASVFVLDFVPNVTNQQIIDKTEEFVRRLRVKHPKTPVIIIGSILFPHGQFDQHISAVVNEKNESLAAICKDLKKKGDKYLRYVSPEHLIGDDGEPTVDGIHLTDLGFSRYAENMYPIIKKYLKK